MAILPPSMLTAAQPGCGCSIVVVVVGGTVVVVVGGMVVVAFPEVDVLDPWPDGGAELPDRAARTTGQSHDRPHDDGGRAEARRAGAWLAGFPGSRNRALVTYITTATRN